MPYLVTLHDAVRSFKPYVRLQEGDDVAGVLCGYAEGFILLHNAAVPAHKDLFEKLEQVPIGNVVRIACVSRGQRPFLYEVEQLDDYEIDPPNFS